MKKQNNKIRILINNLASYGISIEGIQTFIDNNLDIISNEEFDTNKIFVIKNKNRVYAILYVSENSYKWSVNINNIYTRFRNYNPNDKKSATDSLVEMFINIASSDKVNVLLNDANETIENRLLVLKRIGLNSNGYHIK